MRRSNRYALHIHLVKLTALKKLVERNYMLRAEHRANHKEKVEVPFIVAEIGS